MKTQKLKFFVPVLAIIFAISASAFTTTDNSEVDENFTMITGYTVNAIPGLPCDEVTVDCKTSGTQICTIGANNDPVYKIKNGTSCVSHLFRL